MSLRAWSGRRGNLAAVVENLEIRRLLCADHLGGAAASVSSLADGTPALTAAPFANPGARGASVVAASAGSGAIATQPAFAAPGQVNGTAIWGGGIYGAAAASFTTRADGLPILNSLPGAAFTVFLDFDGFRSTTPVVNWTPYDTDGNPAVFGTAEQQAIAEGWRRVASYLAPFDVNVTTIQPADGENLNWAVISNNEGTGFSTLVLGSAWPGAFYPSVDLLRRTSGLLHEIGHNFSLDHQSIYDAVGNKTAEYRDAPDTLHGVIMGLDYAGTVMKWFYGHGSQSTTVPQDDVAVIADKIKPFESAGGDGFRTDDYAGAIDSATELPASSGGAFSAFGVIERLDDVDAFKFESTGGTYTIQLTPDAPSGLDSKLGVYDGAGNLLALSDAASSIDSLVTLNLPAGTYYLQAQSHGNYADIGAYEMRVSPGGTAVVPPTTNSLPGPSNLTPSLGSGTSIGLQWDAVAGASGYQVERSLDGVTFTPFGTTGGTTFADPNPLGSLRYLYRVRAVDVSGVSVPSDPVAIINRPSAVQGFRLTQLGTTQVVLDWLEQLGAGGESSFRIERSSDGGKTFNSIGFVDRNVVIYNDTSVTSGLTYQYRVIPQSSVGDGVSSTTLTVTMRLPAATGLAFTARQSSSLSLSWVDQANEQGFRLERSTNTRNWTTVGTTSRGVTSLTDDTVKPGTAYYYRVSALDQTAQPGVPSSVVFTATPASSLPPAPWISTDVGNPVGVGTTSYDAATDTFKIVAGGAFSNAGEESRFTYQSLTGDGSIIAHVTSVDNTTWPVVGVMFRESTAPNSRFAFMLTSTSGSATQFRYRSATGGFPLGLRPVEIPAADALWPYWLKITRAGNVFTGYGSKDGSNWVQYGQATIPMPKTALVGLDAAASADWAMTTNTLDHVAVIPNPQPPVAVNDSAKTPHDRPVTIAVLANDDDANGDSISVTSTTDGSFGTTVVNTDGTITYTPKAGVVGNDTFGYTITDATGKTARASVAVAVTNSPPVAQNFQSTFPDTSVRTFNVLAGAQDADGDALKLTSVSASAHGKITMNSDGTFNYSTSGYVGPDSFTYTISDGVDSATGQIDVNVTPAPYIPLAALASATYVGGKSVVLYASGSDTTNSQIAYTWALTGGPAAVKFSANGTNAAKTVTATFATAGVYKFALQAKYPTGVVKTLAVSVTVARTLVLAVSPASPSVRIGASQQFTVSRTDQFGVAMTTSTIGWKVSGGVGTVSSTGLFKAPSSVAITGATTLITASVGATNTTVSVKVIPYAPAAPTGLTATRNADRSVRLTWKDTGTLESGYYVDTSLNGTTWTTISTRPAAPGSGTTVSYTTAPFAAGLRYFRVRAFNAGGAGNSASVKIQV